MRTLSQTIAAIVAVILRVHSSQAAPVAIAVSAASSAGNLVPAVTVASIEESGTLLASRKEVRRIQVQCEPVNACLTTDGKLLLVANHLQQGRADQERVAAVVSVIHVANAKVARDIQLPNGSTSLKQIRISPDGKYAAVTHIVASFNRATTSVQLGWLNANALSIIDTSTMDLFYSVLLDTPGRGAANPWGVAWSEDSKTLLVTHAGTHEISVIDFPRLMDAILDGKTQPYSRSRSGRKAAPVLTFLSRYEGMDPGLPYLTGARERIKLPKTDLGPRSVAIVGQTAYVTNYFSETVSIIDLASPTNTPVSIPLRTRGMENTDAAPGKDPLAGMSLARKGEFYFHDATICFQGWQSCSSCHPDGRADGLNWDLLNDGIGNPKNTKSLLLAHQTPPAMTLGIRETAEMAVRSGLRHILFTNAPEEIALAIDEYLKSLKPEPSPHLVNGKLSSGAEHGKQVFAKAGCATCHPPPLFTDLRPYDVGTRAPFDKPTDQFDTPTLIELWRTAPYLHDGSAATVRDVITMRNQHDHHGTTSTLSPAEIDDLCAYLLSL